MTMSIQVEIWKWQSWIFQPTIILHLSPPRKLVLSDDSRLLKSSEPTIETRLECHERSRTKELSERIISTWLLRPSSTVIPPSKSRQKKTCFGQLIQPDIFRKHIQIPLYVKKIIKHSFWYCRSPSRNMIWRFTLFLPISCILLLGGWPTPRTVRPLLPGLDHTFERGEANGKTTGCLPF